MQLDFLLSQVVIVMSLVVSTILGTLLSSGVLLRTTATAHGTAACTTTMARCTGTTTSASDMGFPFAASRIEYLSI